MKKNAMYIDDYIKIAKEGELIKIVSWDGKPTEIKALVGETVGEIDKQAHMIYLWSNCTALNGAKGNLPPETKGYKYSWRTVLRGEEMYIEILDNKKILCNNNIEFTNK